MGTSCDFAESYRKCPRATYLTGAFTIGQVACVSGSRSAPGGPRGLKFIRKLRHLALDDIPRGLGWEMPKNIFHCSSYTSLSHIDLCVGRACAAATFSVPDWLRKHLGPQNSVTRSGGALTVPCDESRGPATSHVPLATNSMENSQVVRGQGGLFRPIGQMRTRNSGRCPRGQ